MKKMLHTDSSMPRKERKERKRKATLQALVVYHGSWEQKECPPKSGGIDPLPEKATS